MPPLVHILIFLSFFQLITGTNFDFGRHEDEKLIIPSDQNDTTFLIRSNTEAEATEKLAMYFRSCESNNTKLGLIALKDYCLTNKNDRCDRIGNEHNITGETYYEAEMEECECRVSTCSNSSTPTEEILYPGCSCSGSAGCNFFNDCSHWTQSSNTPNLTFNVFSTKKNSVFSHFIQTGSTTSKFNNSVVTLMSSKYRQSGLNCALTFMHHFASQSKSSKISVKAHFEDGEVEELWNVKTYLLEDKTNWAGVSVKIGSFSRPFQLSINCESGQYPVEPPPPVRTNKRKTAIRMFVCSIAKVELQNCKDTGIVDNECSGVNDFMCESHGSVKCLKDSKCNLRKDCSDGSDEMNCGPEIYGSRCTFSNLSEYCDGWEQFIRINGEDTFTSQLYNAINNIPGRPQFILQVRQPGPDVGVKYEAYQNSGIFLSYDYNSERDHNLVDRTAALVSPPFPPTNPRVYDKKNPLYLSCKLRFLVCVKEYLEWKIAIIAKGVHPFLSGKQILFSSQFHSFGDYQSSSHCDWQREAVIIPRQTSEFRIAIFLNHDQAETGFFGLDDLSLSPTCFDENDLNETYSQPDILITTCGAVGFEKPPETYCSNQRFLDGQTGHFRNEDGTQDWAVQKEGVYRFEACGAAGGGTLRTNGQPGECAVLQTHLMENMIVRSLVGQMGERACILNERSASCQSQKRGETRPGGCGGGGATLVTVETDYSWNIVAGGGGGAHSDSHYTRDDSFAQLGILSGYGASITSNGYIPECKETCKSVTPKNFMPEKQKITCPVELTTVFGGFGGGGNACGMLGGSGAGYRAGNPLGNSKERSGSSFVQPHFASDISYFTSRNISNGYVKIVHCSKTCAAPSICRFRGEKLEEQYCGCPDGSEFTNETDSCSCTLDCPYASKCLFRNFTFEQFCMCDNGHLINELKVNCGIVYHGTWLSYSLMCLVFVTLICSYIAIRYYKMKHKQIRKEIVEISMNQVLLQQGILYDDMYFGKESRKDAADKLPQITKDTIKFGRALGRGHFGQVIYGRMEDKEGKEIEVAVKVIANTYGSTATSQTEFCNEALCQGTFVHDNIVKLIGVNFKELPFMIASEYMEGGDLLSFMKETRPSSENINPYNMSMLDMVRIVQDVAAGCACLEKYGYVHRDIAARNILLTTKGPTRLAKIADFGMAKEIEHYSDYYRSSGRAFIPVKWAAPEGFIDGKFTCKSDVWSFGILCFEVFSLGVVPYTNKKNEEVMLFVAEGGRVEFPYGIPIRIYRLMRHCWKTLPQNRPSFVDICKELEDIYEDPEVVRMPFPVHPTIFQNFNKMSPQSTVCETPLTALTEVSMGSPFGDSPSAVFKEQQDMAYKIKLHQLFLIRDPPYVSERADIVFEDIRRSLTANHPGNTNQLSVSVYNNQDVPSETSKLIESNNSVQDQTPSPSDTSVKELDVQDTGPTIQRPHTLNFQHEQE